MSKVIVGDNGESDSEVDTIKIAEVNYVDTPHLRQEDTDA